MEVESFNLYLASRSEMPATRLSCQVTLYGRINAYTLLIFTEFLKCYNTVNLGKKSVVTTTAYVGSWVNLGAKLTNNNATSLHCFTTESFYSTSLTCTVTSVSRTTTSFLMCHRLTPSSGCSDLTAPDIHLIQFSLFLENYNQALISSICSAV